jgi:hypothetical protein
MQLCDVPGSELQKMYNNKLYLWQSDALQSLSLLWNKTGEFHSQIIVWISLHEVKKKVFGLIRTHIRMLKLLTFFKN